MGKKNSTYYLHYCFTANIKGHHTKQHVVTDRGEKVAVDIAKRRMCINNDCQETEIKDFKLDNVRDMDGEIIR